MELHGLSGDESSMSHCHRDVMGGATSSLRRVPCFMESYLSSRKINLAERRSIDSTSLMVDFFFAFP